MEMNEQERKAIEEAAKKYVPNDEGAFFHYSDADIWKEGFFKGAEFLAELRKPSENLVLVQQIESILREEWRQDVYKGHNKTAREIAKLMQPDVNAELLKALKNSVLFIKSNDQQPKGLDRWDELVQTIEKQSK
jgi:hypothetical protein